jgi:hypothetical protein
MKISGNRLLGVLLLAGAMETAGTVKRDEPLAGAREALKKLGTSSRR